MATATTTTRYVYVNRILVLVAVIVFVLAAFGVSLGTVSLVPLGLAIWAAAALVP